jgi:hypothetical protein
MEFRRVADAPHNFPTEQRERGPNKVASSNTYQHAVLSNRTDGGAIPRRRKNPPHMGGRDGFRAGVSDAVETVYTLEVGAGGIGGISESCMNEVGPASSRDVREHGVRL